MTDDLYERQREEILTLREEVRQLRELLTPTSIIVPLEYGLTNRQAQLYAHLASREMATKESIMLAIYSDQVDALPDIKIVDVFVCKLRKKLLPFGILIDTIWGQGYALRQPSGRAA